MSEKLDRKGMRKEGQALMHRFVISVRVLFNANLIKGRISVIALLHSSNLAFPFGSQPKICLLFSVLQATSCNLLHAHTHTHIFLPLRLKGPGIGQHSVDCFNKSSNQILSELMQM